jgi:hypothetical protein
MWAVEFETHATDGIIRIPEEYKKIAEGDLKIIILKPEPETSLPAKRQTRISNMKKLLKQIKDRNIFQSVDDPVEWQKKTRNEWT